jgi:hypothetical protein
MIAKKVTKDVHGRHSAYRATAAFASKMIVGLAVAATLVPLLSAAPAQADATYAVMNASGGIYWRSAPDWNTPEAIAGNGFYPGSIIAVDCYQSGAGNVPGSSDSMWEQATVVGGSGSGSGWINEHFIDDGSAITQPSPGVPPCTAPAPVAPAPPPAAAPSGTFAVMNASGGVYWRSAPDWNTPEAIPGNGFYPDTIISVQCYQSGAGNVPGSSDSMWEQATVVGGSGSGSGWINEHFINDGAAINQPSPGVAPCASTPESLQPASNPQPVAVSPQPTTVNPQSGSVPPGPAAGGNPTAAETGAMTWASTMANQHNRTYNGLCLSFVFRAYQVAGVNLRPEVSVPIGSDTYPLDIWGHLKGRTGAGTPPAGALVFFEPKTGSASYRRDYSHVALSLGGGRLVSTADGVNESYTHYETTAQHDSYSRYLGWWLPA